MKNKLLLIVICLLALTSITMASNNTSNNAVKYNSYNGDVSIQGTVCEPWSGWLDWGTDYCDLHDLYCTKHWPPEARYQDQRRTRECYLEENPDDTWHEYEYRTIVTGCCGMPLPLPQ